MKHIARSAIVEHAASAMYDLVERIEAYPEFLPWCREARVRERAAGRTVATLAVGLKGMRYAFTTENMNASVTLADEPDPDRRVRAEFHVVLPEYFDVLDIPLRRGTLPDGWEVGAEAGVIVNERMAATLRPEGDALGARFSFDWQADRIFRVVAVVGDVLDDGYDAGADPAFYVPFGAMPRARMSYVVRTAAEPAGLAAGLRAAVDRIDRDIPAGELTTLSGMMAETVARPRAASLIGLAFALIALLVSGTGIYGVLSYVVEARTREIGIRSALGATGGELLAMVMGHSARLVSLGLVLGIVAALASGRFLSGLLFGVRAWDPLSLLGASLALAAAGALASYVPARRAVRIDPREALRAP